MYHESPASSSSRPKLSPGTSASRLASRWRRWAWAMAESTAWAAESEMSAARAVRSRMAARHTYARSM